MSEANASRERRFWRMLGWLALAVPACLLVQPPDALRPDPQDGDDGLGGESGGGTTTAGGTGGLNGGTSSGKGGSATGGRGGSTTDGGESGEGGRGGEAGAGGTAGSGGAGGTAGSAGSGGAGGAAGSGGAAGKAGAGGAGSGGAPTCARRCPTGWSESGGACVQTTAITLGTVLVRSNGASTTNANPLGAVFPVRDAEMLATTARACAAAVYVTGGIWENPTEIGYTMSCGSSSRVVNRQEAFTWRTPQTFCWDVPASVSCGVTSTGAGNWTPGGQPDGQNRVTFSVQSYSRPYFEPGDPRCN